MTRSLLLKIELLSDAGPGTGAGHAPAVDRDVPHDSLGVPILPGRRLKGLWKEAVRDLEDWRLVDTSVADKLFGLADKPGLTRISNAQIEDAEVVKEWIRWFRFVAPREFAREQVLASFTSMREQTAMNRSSGTTLDHTLRRVRVLNRGLTFMAEVTLDSTEEEHVRALALGCAAIRRLGVSRTRGFGRVRCALFESDNDLTAAEVVRRQRSVV